MSVFSVTATTTGSVVSIKVTPTSSGTTDFKWVREGVRARIGGTTVEDDGTNLYNSYSNTDNAGIPVGKAYVYVGSYWTGIIDFSSLIGTNVTFDEAGIGPQNPAEGNVDSWDGSTLVVTIVSGSFTNRTTLDKITYGY
jgi:hypothetical protein